MLYSIVNVNRSVDAETPFYVITLANAKGVKVTHKGVESFSITENLVLNALKQKGLNPEYFEGFHLVTALTGAELDATLRFNTAGEPFTMTANTKTAHNKAGKEIPVVIGEEAILLKDGIDVDYDKAWSVNIPMRVLSALFKESKILAKEALLAVSESIEETEEEAIF